ncbi:hypothetical protein I215_07197 [Galbibacter marinus]|uniref:DUF4270 domain-containing protein n=2 Tax=Galbibacter marinus TaxID=555500 RepID=K2Q3N1_9FLAO|nr:hypothetical protein I215_07197 [Galbibacter marinus]
MIKNILKSNVLVTLLVMSGVIFFTACERDYNTIGVDIVDDGSTNINKISYDVKAYNRKLSAVRTDGLSGYQLADYKHPIFGVQKASFASQLSLPSSNPTFGDVSQANEDSSADNQENEVVTEVYLHIPFYSTLVSDTISDDSSKPKDYRVDSIFGNINATFNLKVNEYTKYLRVLDPETNFQEAKAYYSNEDPTEFISTVLFDGDVEINQEELLYFNNEDDPNTPDEDESEVPSERLAPRLRIALNTQFFQEKIINNEGKSPLLSANNFQEYLRGVYVSMETANNDLAMLLDVSNGYIEVHYQYDNTDSEGEAIVSEKSVKLSLSANTANKVNYLSNDPYPQQIADQFTNQDASRLYIQGGAGSIVEVDISNGSGDALNELQEAKSKGWLINEANLIFYVDETAIGQGGTETLPKRIYLYDYQNERPLIDYTVDLSQNTGVDSTSYAIFDGRLDEENSVGPRYKFRITNYINNLIKNDSLNIKLGLSTTNSILNAASVSAILESDSRLIKVPQASIPNFQGTVLYGNNVPNDVSDKKLKLEIYYTEPEK